MGKVPTVLDPGVPALRMMAYCVCVCVCVFSHVLLFCDAMDYSLPGSSVHGILQPRILEWVAMPSSRKSSRPKE